MSQATWRPVAELGGRQVPARVNRQLAFESFRPGATGPTDLLVLTLAPQAGLTAGGVRRR